MRNAIEDPDAVTRWEWCYPILYLGLAVAGALWILGAWTTGGLFDLLS